MHRYRHKNRRKSKQGKIIMGSMIGLLALFTVGYSAFQTTLNANVKGNIYNKGDLCYSTTDNGDGTVTITDYDKTCGSEVSIPSEIKGKKVTKIGDTTWNVSKSFNSKGLTKVVIPDTVTYIGNWAFWDNSISSLDLGKGVQSIGVETFAGNKIENITFPESLKKINDEAFRNNNLTAIPSLENIEYGGGAFTQNNLTGDDVFIYGKNSSGIIDNTILNSYGGKTAQDITVPSTVKILSDYAFRQISATTLNLTNVETIKYSVFFQTYIPVINISSSIKSIHSQAIKESPNIKAINIERSEDSISGAPWGASNDIINWTGTN